MKRAEEAEALLSREKEPLALQAYQSLQVAHRRFTRVKRAEREVAARWKEARFALEAVSGKAYDLVAYCSRQVRTPGHDSWEGKVPIDPVEVEKRVKQLFKGFLPSDLREDLGNLVEVLEHIELVLQTDSMESARWDPRFIDAVQQCAPSLRRAIQQAGDARLAHGTALNRLRRTRAEWDLRWTVLETLVLGLFELQGRKNEVERVFEPVRLRGTPRQNGKKPPDPPSQ